jgi:hypothetical protein
VDFSTGLQRSIGDIAEEVVQQLMEQDRTQALGDAGRILHVDEQEGPQLPLRSHVAAGEEIAQRAKAQQVADLDGEVGQHRHGDGERERTVENLFELKWAGDEESRHQQSDDDDDDVEDDPNAEVDDERQPPQTPDDGKFLPPDFEQDDRRGYAERAGDAGGDAVERHIGGLVAVDGAGRFPG